MTKGIIYYTDNRLGEPIFSTVQKQMLKANLPITSVSLKPINFGDNTVIKLSPSYLTMIKQIRLALYISKHTYVFFCEHDVLYPPSHFDFVPPRDDIYYYNANVWRWKYPANLAITYDRLISLSGLCVNRRFALAHYKSRLKKIEELSLDKQKGKEPLWARRWGYEPGTKKTKRGGFSNDDFETWSSEHPIIDIRHGRTFSPPKVTLDSFKHAPNNWRQTTLDKIPGWNLKELFKLS
jgi:hypothetical protein